MSHLVNDLRFVALVTLAVFSGLFLWGFVNRMLHRLELWAERRRCNGKINYSVRLEDTDASKDLKKLSEEIDRASKEYSKRKSIAHVSRREGLRVVDRSVDTT